MRSQLFQLARIVRDGHMSKAQADQLAESLVRLAWGASVQEAFHQQMRDRHRKRAR